MAPLHSSATLVAADAMIEAPDLPWSYGWISSPDGRGTIDILLGCLITIFLCSWSVLFLNILPAGTGQFWILLNKVRWMAFAIFFPEMITGIAAEQWRSAIQSVEDFSSLKIDWERADKAVPETEKPATLQANLAGINRAPWTMRHAFLADMGGFLLKCPDFPAIPIDGFQLAWLVERGYLSYPEISKEEIWDKNKADWFARAVTVTQIIWFSIQAFGRWAQHLALSTFELSTLAFIFCSLNTFFFWRHKPLDVETAITLPCAINMKDIISAAGELASRPYVQTPLDFVKPRVSRASLITPFWFAMDLVFNWQRGAENQPVKSFGNHQITPPRGIKVPDIIFALVFTSGYFAIYLGGWNFSFPTSIEKTLWRVASMTLLGLLIVYLAAVAIGTVVAGSFAKIVFNNHEAITITQVAGLLPYWVAVLVHGPFIAIYVIARSYIIVEGFIDLRAMPSSAFETVNWWNFLPHY